MLVDVDYSHHWTSPIVWEASSTGNYHVSFEKTFDSLATYQLTVDPYDFTDDFGDVVEASSWIEPGTTIEGVLETPSDVDYFRFEATQGQSYSFATESGIATLRDADGVWLAGPSPVPSYYVRPQFIEWQANATDVYYLMVTGLRHGHRPLTFRVRFELSNYVDDRSDDIDGATEVELGQEVWGFAVGSHDFDYFRFSAESGRSYHIVVNDGPDRSIIDGGQYYEAQVYLLGPRRATDPTLLSQ